MLTKVDSTIKITVISNKPSIKIHHHRGIEKSDQQWSPKWKIRFRTQCSNDCFLPSFFLSYLDEMISYDVTTSISLLSPTINAFLIPVQADHRCTLYQTIPFFLSHRWRKGCEPERISPSEMWRKENRLAFCSSKNRRFIQIPWCRSFLPSIEAPHRPLNTSPTTSTHE